MPNREVISSLCEELTLLSVFSTEIIVPGCLAIHVLCVIQEWCKMSGPAPLPPPPYPDLPLSHS